MRRQILASAVAIVFLAVSPVFADTLDFSTDPNLATNWTRYHFYNPFATANFGATWNGTNQNLGLTSTNSEALEGLFRTGDTRSAADGVTVTYSNYVATTPTVEANWTCAGLIVSANAAPGILDGSPWYSVYFQQEYDIANHVPRYRMSVNRNLDQIGNSILGSVPSTMKLDIVRDGADYVFKANGEEICRDSTYSSTSLSHYFMYWGGGALDTLSVAADGYGVVPEPSAVALCIGALLGLLAYAWKTRR
jgi:hypothetical protein